MKAKMKEVQENVMHEGAELRKGARKRFGKDKGDLVQTIIIIAGFAVAAIVAIGMLSSTLMNKSEAAANCIAGSSNFTNGGAAKDNCKTADDAAAAQSKDDIAANKS